jgi:hypothetical protein
MPWWGWLIVGIAVMGFASFFAALWLWYKFAKSIGKSF